MVLLLSNYTRQTSRQTSQYLESRSTDGATIGEFWNAGNVLSLTAYLWGSTIV